MSATCMINETKLLQLLNENSGFKRNCVVMQHKVYYLSL
jgi:hypothetical protein